MPIRKRRPNELRARRKEHEKVMSEEEPGERIEIFRDCGALPTSQKEIRRVAKEALRQLGCSGYQLSVALLEDAGLAKLNLRYLKKRGATDVLAFDLTDGANSALEGQVVISVETARRRAGQHGTSAKAELMLYLVHGILHLCGFDDATAGEAQRMHRREDALLTGLGYGTPFASGGRAASNRLGGNKSQGPSKRAKKSARARSGPGGGKATRR